MLRRPQVGTRIVQELQSGFGQVLRLELACIVSTENLGELKEARQRKASSSFYQIFEQHLVLCEKYLERERGRRMASSTVCSVGRQPKQMCSAELITV